MSSGDRVDILGDFESVSDQPAILANAKCLGEGVDVPSIDGIVFIDPKRSQIDIVQAVGRAIRKSDEDKIGTIILPVFIDLEDAPEEIVKGSDFKDVWAVVKALRDHDAALGETIDRLRIDIGRDSSIIGCGPENIIFDLPSDVTPEFVRAFETRLVEMTSPDFYFGLAALKLFVK